MIEKGIKDHNEMVDQRSMEQKITGFDSIQSPSSIELMSQEHPQTVSKSNEQSEKKESDGEEKTMERIYLNFGGASKGNSEKAQFVRVRQT